MKKKKQPVNDDEVRVIKIGADALFEFIYESIIDGQEAFLDVDPLSVTDSFYMDWENRQLIFCAYKTENSKGELLKLPENMSFEKLMKRIPNTTESMYAPNRYRKYTKAKIEEMCK